jgi:hypothetical protein
LPVQVQILSTAENFCTFYKDLYTFCKDLLLLLERFAAATTATDAAADVLLLLPMLLLLRESDTRIEEAIRESSKRYENRGSDID